MADSRMNKEIFSGLEHLGFDNYDDIVLFGEEEEKAAKAEKEEPSEFEKQKALLYEREVVCPVCSSKFKAKAVKTSAPRVVKKESDFFIRHAVIDPYFYDVWLCNICGYAAMKKDFEKIRAHQIEKVQKNISIKWRGRQYPEVYDAEIAIERYKLSLLNYCVMEAKSSSKAMNCLKLAWMYRLVEDFDKESVFLQQALDGFNEAYYNEDFPIYGMDRFTAMYLIGELNRRLNNDEQAMVWFSKVITAPSVPQKLKELARDQKDLIKDAQTSASDTEVPEHSDASLKKGFFSRLFK